MAANAKSYYASKSGLTPENLFSLSDHELAYWRTKAGLPTASKRDAKVAATANNERTFMLTLLTLPDSTIASLDDLRRQLFISGLG